jgi:hypothetical protein
MRSTFKKLFPPYHVLRTQRFSNETGRHYAQPKSTKLNTTDVRVKQGEDEKNRNDGMLEYWNNGYDSLHHVEKYDDS